MNENHYAVILAGGSGERFWPLSRKARPKQLLSLDGGPTLLERTLRRLEGLIIPEHIMILTNAEQIGSTRAVAAGIIPDANILAEPAKRDTAPAVALAAAWVASKNRAATMLVLPADHVIKDEAAFRSDMGLALEEAEKSNALVTIGIKPSWACPGFGYIEKDSGTATQGGCRAHRVIRFREKPSRELAEAFLREGNFCWNAGMFAWSISTLLPVMSAHARELAGFIETYSTLTGLAAGWEEAFPRLPKTSIDYALLERAEQVRVIDASFDWDDVGSWSAARKYLGEKGSGNRSNAPVTSLNSSNNLVFSDGPGHVALLGVNDLIVVRTGDSLLVAHSSEAENIKQIVAALPAELQ